MLIASALLKISFSHRIDLAMSARWRHDALTIAMHRHRDVSTSDKKRTRDIAWFAQNTRCYHRWDKHFRASSSRFHHNCFVSFALTSWWQLFRSRTWTSDIAWFARNTQWQQSWEKHFLAILVRVHHDFFMSFARWQWGTCKSCMSTPCPACHTKFKPAG